MSQDKDDFSQFLDQNFTYDPGSSFVNPPSFSNEELASLERKKGMTPLLKKVLHNEAIPKEVIGTSQKHIDSLYSQAYKVYNAGKFAEAAQMFANLVSLDYKDTKYLFCLAASLHLAEQYVNATNAYAFYATQEPKNPIPFYHMADCQMKTDDLTGAAVALEMAIIRAADHPQYQVLKDRCAFSLESVKKEMVKRGMRSPDADAQPPPS